MAFNVGKKIYLIAEQARSAVPGGIGTHTLALLEAVSKVISDYPSLSIEIVATRVRENDPLEQFQIPLRQVPLSHKAFMKLSEAGVPVAGLAPGIYHSFSMYVPPLVRSKQKAVVTIHDVVFRSSPDFYPKRGLAWHSKQLAAISRSSFPIVAVSEKTKLDLVSAGIVAERIQVIESGAGRLAVADPGAAQILLHSLGVSAPFILSVSTLEPRKNLEGLLQAFEQIRASSINQVDLVVVGPKGWGAAVRQVSGVHFVGVVSDSVLAGLYNKASLLAYVPFEEGFGLPVVEAMVCGLPVVSSDVPSAAGATELVDPANISSIARGLTNVLTDSRRREELIAKGISHVRNLSWEKSARKHLDLWERI